MMNKVILFGVCVILSEVTTQTLDNLIASPNPVVIQDPKPSSPSVTDSKWKELMPVLQALKNTSKIKKDRLYNVVKIIKFLISDEKEKKGESKQVMEELKETVKEPDDETFPCPAMPDFESIVEERLKETKEIIDDKSYMLDKTEVKNKTEIKDPPTFKNKTADFSKILSKIANALAKVKDRNQNTETQTPKTEIPIFRQQNDYNNEFNPTLYENPKQLGNLVSGQTVMNPKSSLSMFNIPCQKASDILEETASFPLPTDLFCNHPAVKLNALAKNTKLNLDNLPFENVVPNSVTCVDSDYSVTVIFKPKTISLMQVYGNLLKKITITVLVPYYVSKLAF